jgi:hypothetical protein
MNKKLLPWLITICALGLGGTAAYYSIIGLSKLFVGAATAVIIMASFLELSKLTLATLLHSYWSDLKYIQKIYYVISLIILSIITSAGVYGVLSDGYQTTANQSSIVDQKIQTLETKKGLYEDTRNNILKEKQSIAELKGTLSSSTTTQSTDRRGNLVIKSNKANIEQLQSANQSDERLTTKLDITNDSIFALENKILEVKTTSKVANELGPLKYLSNLTGQSMDKIINWFLLVIIFVFDPLAISLVIAANFAFARLKSEQPIKIIPEPIPPIYQPPTQPDNTNDFLSNINSITNSNMDFINKQEQIKNEINKFRKSRDEDIKTYF